MNGAWVCRLIRGITVGAFVVLITGHSSLVTPLAWADEPETEALKAQIRALTNRLAELEAKVERTEAVTPGVPMPAGEISEPSWPVGGIYTVPDTKDLGQLTGISWLSGTKIRGWVDTYFVENFNDPDRTTVNANQGSSVVKGRDISVEGRTFDVHDNSLGFSLAEVEIEKVPEFGGAGFKFDLAFGETQDIIIDSIKGSVGAPAAGDSVTDFDKTFQHASISYLAPIGRGLRFDVGKFVTHIGGETITTVKNWNYSHSYFYTYAIPFQDTGIHVSYPWTDTFYTDFYLLNGWNVTIDNNAGKTLGPSIGWIATPWMSIYTNYLVGPEQADSNQNLRHIWDTQVFFGPFDRWNFMVNYDLGFEEKALASQTQNALWHGVTGYARYKVNDWLEPSLRVEYFKDRDGAMTLLDQDLFGVTLTLNTKLGLGRGNGSIVLFRPEIRYDRSTQGFFTRQSSFRGEQHQLTIGAGLTWLF